MMQSIIPLCIFFSPAGTLHTAHAEGSLGRSRRVRGQAGSSSVIRRHPPRPQTKTRLSQLAGHVDSLHPSPKTRKDLSRERETHPLWWQQARVMSVLSPTQPWVAPSTPAQADDGQAHVCPWAELGLTVVPTQSPASVCGKQCAVMGEVTRRESGRHGTSATTVSSRVIILTHRTQFSRHVEHSSKSSRKRVGMVTWGKGKHT